MSLSVGLIVLAGAVPSRYEAAELLQFVQPAIFESLSLREGERITLHLLKSLKSQQFEQMTEYYPATDKRTRGRVNRPSPVW